MPAVYRLFQDIPCLDLAPKLNITRKSDCDFSGPSLQKNARPHLF